MVPVPIPLEPARLIRNAEGTPISQIYGDIYHSAAGGHAQARHVFLAGNGLPARWQGRECFVILETGFGLGLNFLATWLAWRDDPQRCQELHFVSFEKHPFHAADLALAQAARPEFALIAEQLRERWPALQPSVQCIEFEGARLILTLVFGDAVDTLPRLNTVVDAFYLDAFSPATNPDLWSPALCRSLARVAVNGATLATWSVAASVRQALTAARFDVNKRPGFADKRQMLVARFAQGDFAAAP